MQIDSSIYVVASTESVLEENILISESNNWTKLPLTALLE